MVGIYKALITSIHFAPKTRILTLFCGKNIFLLYVEPCLKNGRETVSARKTAFFRFFHNPRKPKPALRAAIPRFLARNRRPTGTVFFLKKTLPSHPAAICQRVVRGFGLNRLVTDFSGQCRWLFVWRGNAQGGFGVFKTYYFPQGRIVVTFGCLPRDSTWQPPTRNRNPP